jgi:cytochrome c553
VATTPAVAIMSMVITLLLDDDMVVVAALISAHRISSEAAELLLALESVP